MSNTINITINYIATGTHSKVEVSDKEVENLVNKLLDSLPKDILTKPKELT